MRSLRSHGPHGIESRGGPTRSKRIGSWIIVLSGLCMLAGNAASEDAGTWIPPEQHRPVAYPFNSLTPPGPISIERFRLSLATPGSSRFAPAPIQRAAALQRAASATSRGRMDCPIESQLNVVPDFRRIPDWALSEIDECRPVKSSSLDGLIPRISLRGSFFSVGYGIELDKESKGLLVDYGAFTFGIGDSVSGAAVFNGARFGLPRWLPGRDLVPAHMREQIELDVGITLPLDSIDIREWRPRVGIGVKLMEW